MHRIAAVLLVSLSLLWVGIANARGYAALGENGPDIYAGVGGIMLRGDDATGASQDDFLPTVNISGVSDMWAWQVFYAFGDPGSAYGATADYIVASNYEEDAECPEDNLWWFGVGPTLISYTDLFSDAAGANGMDCTCYGLNLGLGAMWDNWNLQLYGHYLVSEEDLGLQASLNYGF